MSQFEDIGVSIQIITKINPQADISLVSGIQGWTKTLKESASALDDNQDDEPDQSNDEDNC